MAPGVVASHDTDGIKHAESVGVECCPAHLRTCSISHVHSCRCATLLLDISNVFCYTLLKLVNWIIIATHLALHPVRHQ